MKSHNKVYMYPKDTIPHELRCKHQDAVMVLRPISCDLCTADELYTLYSILNTAYRTGEPLSEDHYYDRLEARCRKLFPQDPRFWKVGQCVSDEQPEI